ncbi:hypothetical protein [Mangrovibacterium lignilyticum]|uniref:hypothetical protein n=1 Tax=Mangrovibacterium lignilyticum TaxID=2668052 RepID=UPI0013D8DBE1|nr:hypothetical protein [Mangrovibacterium lignilyticum]
MKSKVLLTFAMLCMGLIGMSQTSEEFKPEGKMYGAVFTNFYTTISDGESASGFNLTRLELGYKYQFSTTLSAKACFDIENPKDGGSLDFTAFARNAYLEYSDKGFTVDFGVITANAFNLQENYWGYRYVSKSFQDLYKYSSSRDLGVKAAYKFNKAISADVFIANGEGYKSMQKDSALRVGFGATVHPVEKMTLRAYYDFISKDETMSTLALFAGYATEQFSIGFEYNQRNNTSFVAGEDQSGISTYFKYKPSKKVSVFGRYDQRMSKDDWNTAGDGGVKYDGSLFIAGMEYNPVKGVRLAPTLTGWSPAEDGQPFTTGLLLNCEIKF